MYIGISVSKAVARQGWPNDAKKVTSVSLLTIRTICVSFQNDTTTVRVDYTSIVDRRTEMPNTIIIPRTPRKRSGGGLITTFLLLFFS